MEKKGTYGKDGQLWKRRALMEKTDTYGKDGHFWKRRALMEKTGTYEKGRALMEKTDMCVYITDLNYWIKLLSCIIEANGGHIGLSHINLHWYY